MDNKCYYCIVRYEFWLMWGRSYNFYCLVCHKYVGN